MSARINECAWCDNEAVVDFVDQGETYCLCNECYDQATWAES